MTKPFRLHLPSAEPVPIVASVPHSGLAVPEAIAQTLLSQYQRYLPHQDWHLNQLYDFLPSLGITVLEAIYSRYVVDLNRSAQEPLFGSFWSSVIPQSTAFNQPLYRQRPSAAAIAQRVAQFYHPYHDQLAQLLQQTIDQFGRVYLLDLHSFAGPITDQICLGNANGKSCSEFFIATVEASFAEQGYQVVRNKVFNGGHITQHYGKQPQVEALQIEVRYSTYLEATQLGKAAVPDWNTPEFDQAKLNFRRVFAAIASNGSQMHSHARHQT